MSTRASALVWLPMLTLINVFLHLYRQPIKFSCLDYNLGHTIGDLQSFSSGSIRQKKNRNLKNGIFSTKCFVYKFAHDLPNDVRLRMMEKSKMLKYS